MAQPDSLAAIFPGSSEMASLMRAHDWASTPLGPPSSWPKSLQMVIRVVLTSRYAMWMGWGPGLTFFYNDAYGRMTLGTKHPWALGRPSHEVWAEIWLQIGPRIERVFSTGDATWDEALLLFLERSGYPEETYHTFSYSPLADDTGIVQGLLCVVTEETERVIGERRLALLREVGAGIASTHDETELIRAVQNSLALHSRDLPFTLVYLLERDSDRVHLAGTTSIATGDPAAPVAFDAQQPDAAWPLQDALGGTASLVSLDARFGSLPSGPWDHPPSQAFIVPISQQGQARPTGFFIAGLNPYRPFDDGYRSFVNLLVGQIAAGIANARAYDAERRRAEALAEIDRAKTIFFSNVSHEFRTPLTLLLGPLEDALNSSRQLAGRELETSYRNAVRLLKLVNALLDFARIEAGRADASFQPTDLSRVTADIASTFRSAYERAGLTLTVECEPLSQPAFVDRDMWEKVVLNLLSNAFKFTFDGGVHVALVETADAIELIVQDTGIGVAPADLPRLFERFHRIEGARARTHEGSGIGLALVQELVRLHGGTIRADSEPGRGTTFTISLKRGSAHLPQDRIGLLRPARAGGRLGVKAFVDEARHWLPEEDPVLASDDSSGIDPTSFILVADDNADMRKYVARLLGQSYRVRAVSDGEQAIAALRAERADLIISDVMMPRLDGLGLLRAVREDPSLRDTPFLMLSARSGEEARIEGLEAGADDYVFKPFSARELLARVRGLLALAQARRQAASERDRFRGLLLQVPAVVNFLSGPDLVFEFAHPLAERALGGRPLVGRPLLEAIPEHHGQPFVEMLRRVLTTGEVVSGHERLAWLDRNNTGELQESYWNFMYLPVRSASGEVEGVMTFDLDVTEQVLARKQLEQQTAALARAREDAENASRAKDEFLAMLGHELRNPLAPILTALQLMRLHGSESREQQVIERQVGHLTRLVDDLLDVSRITRGKIELNARPRELADVVAHAMEIASPLLEQRGHHVHVEVPRHGLGVDADLDRLAQVLANLLTNAAKYSDPGSHIWVRAHRDGGDVEIRVKDGGIGIAPDMLTRVFEPFIQQTQSLDRSRGGLGLGLAIVRSLVERHGGTVRAESDGPGRGSEFVVRLPAIAIAEETAPLAETPFETAKVPETRRQRILVVDDNHDAAEMLKYALETLGFVVELAHDGPSALQKAETFQPDIALLDIGLPVMDGYELAVRLRAQRAAGNGLRLIALSGYGQERDRARSMRAGFDAHLVKPIDLGRLEALLQKSKSSAES